MQNNFTDVSSQDSVEQSAHDFDCDFTPTPDFNKTKRKLSYDQPFLQKVLVPSKKVRVKSVGRNSSHYLERNPAFRAVVSPPSKFKIILECPSKQSSSYDFADEETGVSTIDLSKEKREKKENHFDEGGVSIMATALTAAAFSGYLLVKSFKTFLI